MSLDLQSIDWRALASHLGDTAADALAGRSSLVASLIKEGEADAAPVVTGAFEDIRMFGFLVAQDMVIAHATGDEAWQRELGDQIKALAERTRVRVDVARWQFVERVFTMLFRAAVGALGALK